MTKQILASLDDVKAEILHLQKLNGPGLLKTARDAGVLNEQDFVDAFESIGMHCVLGMMTDTGQLIDKLTEQNRQGRSLAAGDLKIIPEPGFEVIAFQPRRPLISPRAEMLALIDALQHISDSEPLAQVFDIPLALQTFKAWLRPRLV